MTEIVRRTTKGEADLPRWFDVVFEMLGKTKYGGIDISLPDGRVFRQEGSKPGPHGRLDIVNPSFFSRLVREGTISFGESYMDGWWTSPDLQALLDMILKNNDEIGHSMPGASLVRAYERLRHWLRSNSRAQARRNISHHYDLGNEFYGQWLDQTMTYSSAMFETGQEDLAAAQTKKYDALCDAIGVKPGYHLLEIGCGWGGFSEHAAATRGARVTGLTISQEQHDFARARMQRQGLGDQVEIVMRDYRDETGNYDGIASIEMFEAVGEKYWPTYFNALHDRLKPGAQAGLQIITVSDQLFDSYRKGVDFIQKHIFPGGMLPSPSALDAQVRAAGLVRIGSQEFGESYSITLRRWRETFNEKWPQIHPLGFDERFYRMWNFYLAVCSSTFMMRTTDVTQLAVARR